MTQNLDSMGLNFLEVVILSRSLWFMKNWEKCPQESPEFEKNFHYIYRQPFTKWSLGNNFFLNF